MPQRSGFQNLFLSRLSAADLELFGLHLNDFEMRIGDRLHRADREIQQVIFPHSGLVAMTTPLHGRAAGAIVIGRDGIVGGLAASASAPAISDAQVRVSGYASRMPAAVFREALDCSVEMRHLAARIYSAMMMQAQQAELCNAAHHVEARICRWLLEIQDRSGDNKFPHAKRLGGDAWRPPDHDHPGGRQTANGGRDRVPARPGLHCQSG